jgi:hypothetical protein
MQAVTKGFEEDARVGQAALADEIVARRKLYRFKVLCPLGLGSG